MKKEEYYRFGENAPFLEEAYSYLYTLITEKKKRIVLLSDAGYGKSTELKTITNKLIKEEDQDFIPILIELDTYVDGEMIDYVRNKIGDESQSVLNYDKFKLVFLFDEFDQVINKEKAVQQACLEAIETGIINSAHDCSEGGLAVALAESCITNKNRMLGATVELEGDMRKDAILFGEAPSRIIVSVRKDKSAALEKIAKRHSIYCKALGNVGGEKLTVQCGGTKVIDLPLIKLSHTWRNAIPSRLGK